MAEDTFKRDPGGPFFDLKRETFAKCRAKGMSIKAAAEEAETSYASGSVWDKHHAMTARVTELREGADNFVPISIGWIVRELKKNAEMARDALQFKASTDTLKTLYDILKKDESLVSEQPTAALEDGEKSKPVSLKLLEALGRSRAASAPVLETTGEEVEPE